MIMKKKNVVIETISYTLDDSFFIELEQKFNLKGKNSHIAEKAVEIIKRYFQSINPAVQFETGTKNSGYDLKVIFEGKVEFYEIKGTEKNHFAWSDIRVSSIASSDAIKNGLVIIRVMNVGNKDIKIAYLKHGDHFSLVEEPRWRISKIK
jgi:hypothetical protein